MQRNERQLVLLSATAIIAAHAALLAHTALTAGPTRNEVGHVVSGLTIWRFGDYRPYRVNPPLIRAVAAAPLLVFPHEEVWTDYVTSLGARPEFELAQRFATANGAQVLWIVTLGRWACIPFMVLGGWISFLWARSLYGWHAALLACSLWATCPSILAHGSLLTPDAHASALGLAASYSFWRLLRTPSLSRSLLCGGLLGMAMLAKLTLIILIPAWAATLLLERCRGNDLAVRRRMAVVSLLVGVYILNLGYAFDGSFAPLGSYRFVSESLRRHGTTANSDEVVDANRFAGSLLGRLPVPLPREYVCGFDAQKKEFERRSNTQSYLRGTFRSWGWWYYYVYAALIKLPLPFWIVMFLAFAHQLNACLRRPAPPKSGCRDEAAVLLPMAGILLLVSAETGMSMHARYALPCLPFLFVWTGQAACIWQKDFCSASSVHMGTRTMMSNARRRVGKALVVSCVLWLVVVCCRTHPHYLSYFNELIGSPSEGAKEA